MSISEHGRKPPQDLEAEASVLGAMMLSKDVISDVINLIKGTDYYRPANQVIHDAILDLYGKGEPVDAITVVNALTQSGELNRVGGAAYIHTLIAGVPTAANAGYYARIVKERSQLRTLVSAGTRIVQLGYSDEGGEVDDIINRAQAEIFAVTQDKQGNDYRNIGDIAGQAEAELKKLQANKGQTVGVPTGFLDLDKLTNGLQPGQLIIVAARPAMGKSTLAMDLCRSAAIKNKISTVVFSLEMDALEITKRVLAAESHIQLGRMNSGEMEEEDWIKLSTHVNNLEDAPLFIDDSPNLTMPEIRSKCMRLKQQDNLGLVVVDYLQLMTSGKKVESRQQEVSEFSRSLKLLAKEIGAPIIALAQLNRGPEQRTDHKPMLADLRESGSLEQDADIVMLLHRPEVYSEEDRPGEADLIIAKHRAGPTRTIPLTFLGSYAKFGNPER